MAKHGEHGLTDEDMRASMHDAAQWDALTDEEKESVREFAEAARQIEAGLPRQFAVGSKVRVIVPDESSSPGLEGKIDHVADPADQPEKWLPGAQAMYCVKSVSGGGYFRAAELEAA